MANSEASFRTELLTDFRAAGIRAIGNSAENDVGRPDIYVKDPFSPSIWFELKYMEGGQMVPVTANQHRWMKEERLAGGLAYWLVCFRRDKLVWELYMGREEIYLRDGILLQTRTRGKAWDVEKIISYGREDYDRIKRGQG